MAEVITTMGGLSVFSTCPQSSDDTPDHYVEHVANVSRWSEEIGCTGMLVYTDNRLVDAWLAAEIALQSTRRLCPLVAVQPIYMHPYTVANMVASYSFMHHRRVYLNLVAGGFKNDLIALNDPTPHDRRYTRMIEYATIILELLRRSESGEPLSVEGEFYKVWNLKLTPSIPAEMMPGVFVSGSSDAGMAAARALGATAVQYPKPPSAYEQPFPDDGQAYGIRVGIVAREDGEEAWRVARERFPEDRKGQLSHQLAMKTSDSIWHRQLSELAKPGGDNPYWMHPFENYKTFCPYLVGDYGTVAAELVRYASLGYRTVILDIPPAREELDHIGEVFEICSRAAGAGVAISHSGRDRGKHADE